MPVIQQNTPTTILAKRVRQLELLLLMLEPIPDDWVSLNGHHIVKSAGPILECAECRSWKVLTNSWTKAMHWIEGLDRALSVMLACILSTQSVGDQLWVKIIGPASCGKSKLCEALSVNKNRIIAKSTLKGFHSAFNRTGREDEDNSLIIKAKNKTLVIKDGDTLLQAANLGQILSEARDLYDRVSRSSTRNKMDKDYEGVAMTWILCGTESLRALDSSELGERFIDCVIVDKMHEDLEDEIGLRVAYRAERELSYRSDGNAETQDTPEMIDAKKLTGGYIEYLCENSIDLLTNTTTPDWALHRCQLLAKFVAFLRARPSKTQEEKIQREMSMRLVCQLVRLMKCLAVVLGKREVDAEVMRRVTQVALDTARGRTLKIVKSLHQVGNRQGMSLPALAIRTNETEDKAKTLLRFLNHLEVIEPFEHAAGPYNIQTRWRLTKRMQSLYERVYNINPK